MRRFRWLPVLILALLLLACRRDDPSVLHLPEATAEPQGTLNTPEPLTPAGDRVCVVGQETLPESSQFSFVVGEISFEGADGLKVAFSYQNKSATRTFLLSLDALAVNGYMQPCAYGASVAPGAGASGELRVPAQSLRSAGIASVEELVLYPLVYDESVPQGQGDAVDGAFRFYPTGLSAETVTYPVRRRTDSEAVIFDTGFGSLILLEAKSNEAGDLVLEGYLENRTDRFLGFAFRNVTLNGQAVAADWDAAVAGNMRAYVTFAIEAQALPQGTVEEIAFAVTGTPLSNTETAQPLIQQQGVYRLSAAASGAAPSAEAALTTASPTPGLTVYTKPTKEHTKNAKAGYVAKDKVNMRAGPGTQYSLVQKDLAQYTAVTLYEQQNGWWFLKCGNKYGYIRSDMVAQGSAPKTPQPQKDASTSYEGTVTTQSNAVLRKEADKSSKYITEYTDGQKLTVYYKTKGADGKTWYYVSDGKHKGYIRSDLIKTSNKVPSK